LAAGRDFNADRENALGSLASEGVVTLDEFQTYVRENATAFAGVHRENSESLAVAERTLGVALPPSLKWLLCEYGYSAGSGIYSLEESVESTLRCRQTIGLPRRYVILEDRGDAGVVLLDSNSPAGRVIWLASHAVSTLAIAEPIVDIDEFPNYATWAAYCLKGNEIG
jgi:SMI1-KNR4 cell-wall